MLTVPVFMSAPVFGTLSSGGADWPTLGAVIGWLLLAAVVGSALGILQRGTRRPVVPVYPERVRFSRPATPRSRMTFNPPHHKAA